MKFLVDVNLVNIRQIVDRSDIGGTTLVLYSQKVYSDEQGNIEVEEWKPVTELYELPV